MMRPLSLDYQRHTRRVSAGGLLLLAAGALATAFTLADYQRANGERVALQEQADLLDARPDRKSFDRLVRPGDAQRTGDETKQIDQVLRQLETPWGALFDAVESASDAGVALLALQPDTQQRLLRIVAESRTPDDMLEYVKRLGENAALLDVHLVNHQVQTQDPNRPLRFTVQAGFVIAQ